MKFKYITLLFFVFLLIFSSKITQAKIGVGVGTGKIVVNEILKSGTIYRLPSLTVINTGDESSTYETEITYHQDQTQAPPPQEWFHFSPRQFDLLPGQVQSVQVTLNLPLKTIPGEYFAYIEAHPLKQTITGNTIIGVAAAAKLYFSIAPASIIEAVYYKIVTFLAVNQPWTNRIVITLGVIILILTFQRFFNIKINFKKDNK